VAGYVRIWFTHQQTVTHPSTNRVRRRVTMLIETNALPLSHASSQVHLSYLDVSGGVVRWPRRRKPVLGRLTEMISDEPV